MRGLINGWTRKNDWAYTAQDVCQIKLKPTSRLLFDDWDRSPLTPLIVGGDKSTKVPRLSGGGQESSLKVPLAFGGCEGDRASATNKRYKGFYAIVDTP